MRIFRIFSPAAFSRLVATVRQDGLRVALARSRSYLRRAFTSPPGVNSDARYLDQFWQDSAQRDAFHVSQAPALLTKRRRVAMIGDLFLPQCLKYRVVQPAELWAEQGVEYTYSSNLDIPRAINALQSATHVMFYRTLNDERMAMYLYEARRLRLPVLYDLDDPLFSISAYETYENMKALPQEMKAHFLREAPRYLSAMNQADLLTVSTPGMVAHTQAYTARPVHFRRNFADQETLAAAEAALKRAGAKGEAPFRVAFASGSQGHEIDFALIADDLIRFLAADAARQLVIIGHFDKTLLPEDLQDRVEMHKFSSYGDYLGTLSTVDCAVMPLTNDAFNRCKSAVRVIDAAAVAVPSLVGTVSDMAQMVKTGETGWVLGPGDSWGEALERMAQDRAGTAAMGQAARQDLLQNWTARPEHPVTDPALIDWVKG